MSLLYHLCKPLVVLFFRIFTRWKVCGAENIPRTGPVLVVSNHLTFAEPPILSILIKRPSRFATKDTFYRFKPLAWVLTQWGGFPVHPGRGREDISTMLRLLRQGLVVVIFPEGTRSREIGLLPAFHGAAMVARRASAPVLPVGVTGTEQLRRKMWMLRRPTITIRFGVPFRVTEASGRQEREAATSMIMSRIAELLPPEYHGAYAGERES